ncbi:unnamed protein product [Nezara viridula]|uniref:Uncharacterized protein n=1 Tax=Nezara viridula TaxID=85310 RepID=A0A9P0H115_NEZVI|nr:unnamed protein product [Nezara viridula]
MVLGYQARAPPERVPLECLRSPQRRRRRRPDFISSLHLERPREMMFSQEEEVRYWIVTREPESQLKALEFFQDSK